MPHHQQQYPLGHERMLRPSHRPAPDGNPTYYQPNISSNNGRFENNRALHEMQQMMMPRNSAIRSGKEPQFSKYQQEPGYNTRDFVIHHGEEEFFRRQSVSVPVSTPSANHSEIVHQRDLLVNDPYANTTSHVKGIKPNSIGGISSQSSHDFDGGGGYSNLQVFQRNMRQTHDPHVSMNNNNVNYRPQNYAPSAVRKEVRQETPSKETTVLKEGRNSHLTTTVSMTQPKCFTEEETKTSSHESSTMTTVSSFDEKSQDNSETDNQNQNQSLSSVTASEVTKEHNESREKELVNGALLALVSLASGTPSSSSDESRKVVNSNCINTGTTTNNSASPSLPRSREVKTPPPSQDICVSTITPSSSAANFNAMNNRHRLNTSLSNCSVSERSDLSHNSCSNSQVERSIEHVQQRPSIPINSPPSIPASQPERRRRHNSLPCVQESLSEHIPMRYTSDFPVPKLETNCFTSQPRYTLLMKRDPERSDEGCYLDDSSLQPQYAQVHRIRAPRGAMSRPTRFHSEPVRYSRQAYRSEAAPPLPRMAEEYPHIASERVVGDFSGNYGVEMRTCVDDRRGGGVIIHEHLGGRYDNSISRAASRDDYEETRQSFRATRHPSEDTYYSQSDRFPPMPNRGRSVSLSSPNLNTMIQRTSSRDRLNQEVRVQFVRPDHLDPRAETVLGHCASFSSQVDYTSSPYHSPTYQPHLVNSGVKKTILRRKCAWKNYPELEKFLIENREEYLKHSAKNYTVEQKQYNNRLTERLLEVAAKHNYVFDPMDFNFVGVRDRIRCYYKSYVQSNKKRGVIVGYDAKGSRKKLKREDDSVTKFVQKEKSTTDEVIKGAKKTE